MWLRPEPLRASEEDPMYDYADGMGWWMLFPSILFVLFVMTVIALAFWAALGLRSESSNGREPIDIAKERYSRGEISRVEFERIKEDLRKAA